MPKLKGTGTTEEIAAKAASLNLDLEIPEQAPVNLLDDPLPSLQEGEGIQEPLGFTDRLQLGAEIGSPTYNIIGGLSKDYDPTPDPTFDIGEHKSLFKDLDNNNYSYMIQSVSLSDAEHRRREIDTENLQMQRLMKDGGISGMGYMMAAGTVLDPIFWASVFVEGGGAINVISKADRARRAIKAGTTAKKLGALTAVTASTEVGIVAGHRATVDAEDVLYAGLTGLALGSAAGKLNEKFLQGEDFNRAANAVQDEFSKSTTRTMDEDLVTKPRRNVEEADSVFGKHDPDLAAERAAEKSAEDIVITPDEPIDEAVGYADALYKQIDEMKADGRFDPEVVRNSKTFKVLEKNPLMSDFMRLFKSDSEGIQYLAMNLLENGSGVAGRQKTAAILKHVYERRFLEQTMPNIRQSYLAYAKDNGIGILRRRFLTSGRDEHFKIIRTELENYRNASVQGVEYVSSQPKYIQEAVDSWRKSMKEVAELARTSGVRGFDEIKVHDGYVPLLWNGNKIARMSKPVRTAYQSLLVRGYQKAGIDAKSAEIIAKAVFNRKTQQAVGLDTNPGALLSKDSREFLREMLDLNNVSKAEQDALFGRIDVTLAERGKSARAKGRVPVDLTVSDGERSLFDIVNNDLASVGSRYFTEISGRSALATKGIRHDGAWRAVKNAVLKEAFEKGEDTEVLAKTLDGVYLQFLGQPVGEGVNKGARRLMELAMTSMLGTVGMAQMAESANVIAAHGISNLMKYSPDLKAFRQAVKAGNAEDSLLGELQAHIGGLWDEHLFYRPEVRLDQTPGQSSEMFQVLDNVLASSREILGYASGMNHIKNIQQQFVAVGQANKVVKMIQSGDTERLLSRFEDIGWTQKTLDGIKSKLDDGTITFQPNGNVDKLNLGSWSPELLEDFTLGMHRHSAQLIQFPLIGETAYWQHKTIGAMLSQFRSFSMLAIEKQTARNLRFADPEAATAFGYSIGLSSLLYMTKVQATSVGRPDREEYLERRLNPAAVFNGALQWSGMFSIASEGVNAASATGLLPADWGSGSVGRAGTSAFSFDRQVPSLSVLRSGMQFTTGLTTGISPFNDHKVGNKEIDSFFASVPLGNIYPSIVLKNLLHNLPEED